MTSQELLLWARGTGLSWAMAIFMLGTTLRLIEIFALGHRPDFTTPRKENPLAGIKSIFTRFLPTPERLKLNKLTVIGGMTFHIGLFIVIFFTAAHIELFRSLFGFGWPHLSGVVIDFVTVVTLISLLLMLIHRMMHPVKRYLSTVQDYFVWLLTFLPVLTGYMAYHHIGVYEHTLAMHILSAELLLICLPFTNLFHAISVFPARWFSGTRFGKRGVEI